MISFYASVQTHSGQCTPQCIPLHHTAPGKSSKKNGSEVKNAVASTKTTTENVNPIDEVSRLKDLGIAARGMIVAQYRRGAVHP
jgi:hypothetical protein